jgi:hypothetical protein
LRETVDANPNLVFNGGHSIGSVVLSSAILSWDLV